MGKIIDLTGQRFGRLIVIRRSQNNKYGNTRWLCQCQCGKEKIINGKELRNGDTQSCGCLRKDIFKNNTYGIRHGYTIKHKIDPIYKSWDNIKQRCNNRNDVYYGGRGIKVCDRWLEPNGQGFINFVKDMGERPPGTSIDRIDNNGDYCKENCRWVTRKQQMRNTRYNKLLTIDGITRCLIKWCEIYKLPYKKVYDRIYKLNWTPKEALEIIPRKKIK